MGLIIDDPHWYNKYIPARGDTTVPGTEHHDVITKTYKTLLFHLIRNENTKEVYSIRLLLEDFSLSECQCNTVHKLHSTFVEFCIVQLAKEVFKC